MTFEKMFSVIYVLETVAKHKKLNTPTYVFQNEAGIFSAKPFIVEDGLLQFSYVNESYLYPFGNNEISAVDSHANEFFKALSSSGSQFNRWPTITSMSDNISALFEYVSDQYDLYETEATNDIFDRKMYGVRFLDKQLDLDFMYVDEEIKLLSIFDS